MSILAPTIQGVNSCDKNPLLGVFIALISGIFLFSRRLLQGASLHHGPTLLRFSILSFSSRHISVCPSRYSIRFYLSSIFWGSAVSTFQNDSHARNRRL